MRQRLAFQVEQSPRDNDPGRERVPAELLPFPRIVARIALVHAPAHVAGGPAVRRETQVDRVGRRRAEVNSPIRVRPATDTAREEVDLVSHLGLGADRELERDVCSRLPLGGEDATLVPEAPLQLDHAERRPVALPAIDGELGQRHGRRRLGRVARVRDLERDMDSRVGDFPCREDHLDAASGVGLRRRLGRVLPACPGCRADDDPADPHRRPADRLVRLPILDLPLKHQREGR